MAGRLLWTGWGGGDGVAAAISDREPAPSAGARPSRGWVGRGRLLLLCRRGGAEGHAGVARGGLHRERPGRVAAGLGLGTLARRGPLARAGRGTAMPAEAGGGHSRAQRG